MTDSRLKIPAALRCALIAMVMLFVAAECSRVIADASSSGAKNIRAFGATGSLATVTARTIAGNAQVTVGSTSNLESETR